MRKIWKTMLIILSLASAGLGIWGCGAAFVSGGAAALCYYTQDSNIFAVVVNLAGAVALIAAGKRKNTALQLLRRLRYYAACCVAITLMVVLFVLGPGPESSGYAALLLQGVNLPLHLLCPVLTILTLALPDGGERLPLRCALFSLVPTVAYGVPVVVLNIMGKLSGPYFFLRVRENGAGASLAAIALILAGAYAIGLLMLLLFNSTKHKILTENSKSAEKVA